MRLLLDTHCWLWWLTSSARMRDEVCDALADGSSQVYLSAASTWEIAIKASIGRLALPLPPEVYVPSRMAAQGVGSLPIEHVHAARVATLPRHHHDPFDRMLVAQSQVEGLTLVTADSQLAAYDVELMWAARRPAPR